MTNQTKDTPGVIAPPPLIFLGGLALGLLGHRFYPLELLPPEYLIGARIAGILLTVAGLGIIFAARGKMRRAKTNIEPWKPTTAILTDGIYSYSRNPVYAAMVAIYLGIGLIFNSIWVWPLLALVLAVMHYGVIRREEKYLENKFGDQYLKYKKRVRRWI